MDVRVPTKSPASLPSECPCALCEGDAQQRLDQSKLITEEASKTTVGVQQAAAPMASNLTNWSQNLQSFDSSAYNTAVDSARDAGITVCIQLNCPLNPTRLLLRSIFFFIWVLDWSIVEVSLEKKIFAQFLCQYMYVCVHMKYIYFT